jgi:peptidoglycan/LPS O-acetylase OafA/YrhL
MKRPGKVISRLRSGAPKSPLEQAVSPSFGARLAGIEGMRALAASTILVYHVWLNAPPDGDPASFGYLTRFMPDLAFGVTLFFTLSGFLLYRPFVSALVRGRPRPGFVRYLRNRALRIAPAYWAILILTSFVLQTTLVRDAAGVLHEDALQDPLLLARNALLVQGYFPDSVLTGIAPAWSLAVEVVFYLTLPLAVLLAFALARRATTRAGLRLAAIAPPVLLLLVGLSGKATAAFLVPATTPGGGWGNDWHAVLERSFLSQADLFAFGMALAVVRIDVEDGILRPGRPARWAIAASALGAYLITAANTSYNHLGYSPFNTLMALSTGLLLALVVLPAPGGTQSALVRLLESRALVGVGLVSYSLFLWHYPVIGFLARNGLTLDGEAGFFVNLLAVGAACLALSALSYRLVERPALLRKRRSPEATGSAVPAPAPAE